MTSHIVLRFVPMVVAAACVLLCAQPEAMAKRIIRPTIGEGVVRQWFDAVQLEDFRRVSLYHEFQPIDGNLAARYEGKGERKGAVLYLSYVDNERKDPLYGMFRTAYEIASVGDGLVRRRRVADRVWYGSTVDKPTAVTDVGKKVRVVVMGYEGLTMEDVFAVAEGLDLSILETAAAKKEGVE